jgi:hypothetical protein
MLFRVLVLMMAGILLAKATIALAIPQRFYAERQRQYASPFPPRKVFIGPAVIVGLAATAWYATIFHYEPWGWVVTVLLTAFACATVHRLLHWEAHRQKMGRLVADPKVWRVDCLLLAIGTLLMGAGFLVYE